MKIRINEMQVEKKMIISERIFYVMEQKNITQLELSRRTGIATSNISDWKKKKTNPKADCLLSICDALEITPDQLLTGKEIDHADVWNTPDKMYPNRPSFYCLEIRRC